MITGLVYAAIVLAAAALFFWCCHRIRQAGSLTRRALESLGELGADAYPSPTSGEICPVCTRGPFSAPCTFEKCPRQAREKS